MPLFYRNEKWKRVLHFTHLVSTLVLYYTGVSWYFPALAQVVGGYGNIMFAHRVAAAIFIVVPLYMLTTRWKKVVHTLGELVHWTGKDTRWMLKFPTYIFNYEKTEMPNFDAKFNPGQRFSGSMQVGLCLLMGISGLIWVFLERYYPQVPQIVFNFLGLAHLLGALFLLLLLLGHIYLGAGIFRPYRGMIRTMFGDGFIDKDKAYKIWPQWAEEMEQQEDLGEEAARD